MGHGETREQAHEMAEAFASEFGLNAFVYDVSDVDPDYPPQIQVDNGKPYGEGLSILYQGPATEFEPWALAFAWGWQALSERVSERLKGLAEVLEPQPAPGVAQELRNLAAACGAERIAGVCVVHPRGCPSETK